MKDLSKGIFVVVLSTCGVAPMLLAQEDPPGTSPPAATRPEDLVYAVNRTPELAADTARAVTIITAEDIARKSARTLPEVLMEEAGLFVQATNYGSGSPIIRGLMGKQILILIDGVKVNNATYRTGGIQYLNTIDLAMVERIEIVRGVVSVLGADALGGIINIITRKGATPDLATNANSRLVARYSTADRGFVGRAEGFAATSHFRVLAGVTYRDAGDLDGGGDIGRQTATGYDEKAGNLFVEYALAQDRTVSFAYQVMDQNEVPRTDRITSKTNTRFDFDPQRLQLATLAYQDLALSRFYESLRLSLYWNRQDEGRFEIRPAKLNEERRLMDRDNLFGASLEMASSIGKAHRLLYGVDYWTEGVDSTRNDVSLVTGASAAKRGTYTDGASYDAFAAYLQDQFNAASWLTIVAGGRLNHYSMAGDETSSLGALSLDSGDTHLTGSLNNIFHVAPGLNVLANATTGYRALNIEDVSVFDERPEGTEIPNPDLAPERIAMYEAGVKYSNAKLSATAFAYHSRISDMLVRGAGTYEGLPFFDRNDNGTKDAGEPNVLQRQNTGESTVQGVELEARYRPIPDVQLLGSFTATTGDDDVAQQPLARIPPKFATLGARWTSRLKAKPWAEVVFHCASAQRRLNPADVSDTRIGASGTDGFGVFTLRAGATFRSRIRGTLILENLTDEKYKIHGSGLYRPGRQLVLALETRF